MCPLFFSPESEVGIAAEIGMRFYSTIQVVGPAFGGFDTGTGGYGVALAQVATGVGIGFYSTDVGVYR